MREGQGVCHILTQHLGETTKVLQTLLHQYSCSLIKYLHINKEGLPYVKLDVFPNFQAFEELLRANDIDYYMGQSFREQLAQGTALAHRVAMKISGRKKPFLFSSKTSKYSSQCPVFLTALLFWYR